MNQPQAFDPLAPAYDDAFTHTQIGRYLRGQAHERLRHHFDRGDHVLELGCGTGEDALLLAERSVRVTATDVSQAMLAVARVKTAGNPLVHVTELDLRNLPLDLSFITRHSSLPFTGAFSNFGALNCLDDWQPLAAWLAERVRPGGVVAFGIMSPLCLWEPLWHSLHRDFTTATRRWRKSTTFQPQTVGLSPLPAPITVTYPTIRRLTRDFAPYFRRIHVQPLGLFLPPSDVFGVVEKRPRLLKLLMALERRFTHFSPLSPLADHYWIEFQRAHERS